MILNYIYIFFFFKNKGIKNKNDSDYITITRNIQCILDFLLVMKYLCDVILCDLIIILWLFFGEILPIRLKNKPNQSINI